MFQMMEYIVRNTRFNCFKVDTILAALLCLCTNQPSPDVFVKVLLPIFYFVCLLFSIRNRLRACCQPQEVSIKVSRKLA